MQAPRFISINYSEKAGFIVKSVCTTIARLHLDLQMKKVQILESSLAIFGRLMMQVAISSTDSTSDATYLSFYNDYIAIFRLPIRHKKLLGSIFKFSTPESKISRG